MCTSMKWRRAHGYGGGYLSSRCPFHHSSCSLPTFPSIPLLSPFLPPTPPLHPSPYLFTPLLTPTHSSTTLPTHPTPPLHSPLTPLLHYTPRSPKPSPALPQCPASSHVPRRAGNNRRSLPCCLQLHGHTRRLPQLSTTAHLLRRKGACCITGVGLTPSF